MPTRRQMRLISRDPFVYVLRDLFALGSAAPIPSPFPCIPGPESLSMIDASNVFTRSGGGIVANGTAAALSGIFGTNAIARRRGRAFFISLPVRTSGFTIGANVRWGLTPTQNATTLTYGMDAGGASSTHRIKDGVTPIDSIAFAGGEHQFAIVLRGTGAYLFQRTGTTGLWRLYWVYATGTGALFPSLQVSTSAAVNFTSNKWSVIDFGEPWMSSDYGIATSRLVNPSASTATPANTDSVLEFTFNHGGVNGITTPVIRYTDANNYLSVICRTTDQLLALQKTVAGTPSTVVQTGSVFTSNNTTYRVVVTMEGSAYRIYVNDVLKAQTTDAHNSTVPSVARSPFANAQPSEMVLWPRFVQFPNGFYG
jgi:hypothetical protein